MFLRISNITKRNSFFRSKPRALLNTYSIFLFWFQYILLVLSSCTKWHVYISILLLLSGQTHFKHQSVPWRQLEHNTVLFLVIYIFFIQLKYYTHHLSYENLIFIWKKMVVRSKSKRPLCANSMIIKCWQDPQRKHLNYAPLRFMMPTSYQNMLI